MALNEESVDAPSPLKVAQISVHRVSTTPCPKHTRRFSIGEGHKSVMLNEILDQPKTVVACLKDRLSISKSSIFFKEIEGTMFKHLTTARRIIIVGCGSSHHAATVGEYLLEQLARIATKAEYGSEFRYKALKLDKDSDVLIVLSQSGETADTLAALRSAKKQGVPILAIVNDKGSAIDKEADATILLHAGRELGLAATKTFTATLLVLTMLALQLSAARGTLKGKGEFKEALDMLHKLPTAIEKVLTKCNEKVKHAAKVFRYASNFLVLGRGFNFSIALEGALKLKEIAKTHAEGYPAAEMKHGPIALIDRFMPVLFIAPRSDATYSKIKANISEVLARKGAILIITEEDNPDFPHAEYVFPVPGSTAEWLFPILAVLPLQLLAYHIANMRGMNVDRPSGLQKTHKISPSLSPLPMGTLLPGHVRTDTDMATLKV